MNFVCACRQLEPLVVMYLSSPITSVLSRVRLIKKGIFDNVRVSRHLSLGVSANNVVCV